MAILENEKQLDKVLEAYYNRYNKFNEKVLKTLGETVKEIGDMEPSEVHQLSQQIKYSEDINKLIQELSDITDLSSQDIETLFEKFARENVEFSEAYYEAQEKEYKNYDDNVRLKRMVESIKNNTKDTMVNLSNTSAIGFVYKDNFGNKSFKGLQKTYYDLVDEAVYQVATGTVDYNKAMRNVLNGLADSGIRTREEKIGYKSGYSRRLDSAIKQNILDGLRKVNIDIQSQIGNEIGADGIEITAHTLCAPDHIPYQGRQYTKEEFEKINDYELDRPIATGMYNCRHFAMQVVLGVDEPMYSKEDLKRFEEESFSKVKYNGKTYTKYEATQIQRQLETAIRKQKDRQIVAKASGDTEGVRIAQQKISSLTNEYVKFSNTIDLKVYKDRLTVSGYKRVKTDGKIAQVKDEYSNINYKNYYDTKYYTDNEEKWIDGAKSEYSLIDKIKKVTKDANETSRIEKAIEDYTNENAFYNYGRINGNINSFGIENVNESVKEKVNLIEKAIEKNKIPDNIYVYRVVDKNDIKIDDTGNHYIQNKGFTSTSVEENTSVDFIDTEDKIKLKIKVLKGTSGLYIGEDTMSIVDEDEILFGLNKKIIIEGDYKNKKLVDARMIK